DGVDGRNDSGEWHSHSRGNLRIGLTRRRARHRSGGAAREAHSREDRVDLRQGRRGVECITRWGCRGPHPDASALASRRVHHAHREPGAAALENGGEHQKENWNHEEQLDRRRASLPSSLPLQTNLAVSHGCDERPGPSARASGCYGVLARPPYDTPGIEARTVVNAVTRPAVTGATSAVPTTARTATQMVHSGSSAPASSR